MKVDMLFLMGFVKLSVFCLKLISFSFAATFLMNMCVFMPDSVGFGSLFACLHVWLGLYLPLLVFENYLKMKKSSGYRVNPCKIFI